MRRRTQRGGPMKKFFHEGEKMFAVISYEEAASCINLSMNMLGDLDAPKDAELHRKVKYILDKRLKNIDFAQLFIEQDRLVTRSYLRICERIASELLAGPYATWRPVMDSDDALRKRHTKNIVECGIALASEIIDLDEERMLTDKRRMSATSV